MMMRKTMHHRVLLLRLTQHWQGDRQCPACHSMQRVRHQCHPLPLFQQSTGLHHHPRCQREVEAYPSLNPELSTTPMTRNSMTPMKSLHHPPLPSPRARVLHRLFQWVS